MYLTVCKNKMIKRVCPLLKETLESGGRANFSVQYILKEGTQGLWENKRELFTSDRDRGRVGEGWVLKNETGDKMMRRIFKRKQDEQMYGPILNKMCVHMYVEKGTTTSRALISGKEAGEIHRHWPWKSLRHLQVGTLDWTFKSRNHWVIQSTVWYGIWSYLEGKILGLCSQWDWSRWGWSQWERYLWPYYWYNAINNLQNICFYDDNSYLRQSLN